jgi:hypothetical protein
MWKGRLFFLLNGGPSRMVALLPLDGVPNANFNNGSMQLLGSAAGFLGSTWASWASLMRTAGPQSGRLLGMEN